MTASEKLFEFGHDTGRRRGSAARLTRTPAVRGVSSRNGKNRTLSKQARLWMRVGLFLGSSYIMTARLRSERLMPGNLDSQVGWWRDVHAATSPKLCARCRHCLPSVENRGNGNSSSSLGIPLSSSLCRLAADFGLPLIASPQDFNTAGGNCIARAYRFCCGRAMGLFDGVRIRRRTPCK